MSKVVVFILDHEFDPSTRRGAVTTALVRSDTGGMTSWALPTADLDDGTRPQEAIQQLTDYCLLSEPVDIVGLVDWIPTGEEDDGIVGAYAAIRRNNKESHPDIQWLDVRHVKTVIDTPFVASWLTESLDSDSDSKNWSRLVKCWWNYQLAFSSPSIWLNK